MTTMTLPEIPLETSNPAQRLRRVAAAVRVCFTWWGTHRTLTTQQKEEVCDAYGADARLMSAGKMIIDVRHVAFRNLTSVRSRIASHWRSLTLPYVEPGIRLIKQSDITPFVNSMEEWAVLVGKTDPLGEARVRKTDRGKALMVGQFARWLRGTRVVPDQTLNVLAAELTVGEATPVAA